MDLLKEHKVILAVLIVLTLGAALLGLIKVKSD
jgi:hypothetical protein